MKKAILYIRVSTEEQADKGYSLAHQQERLEKYCELQGYQVSCLYKDDHSAKSFERPQFKKLLEFLRKNKNNADYLLFTKWDRFSRNAGDAYGMINTLRKLGVEPQAIEQPLDLAVPENKLMLAFYLAAPEVENDRRSLNILVGMRKARKEGRYIGLAPMGYKNVRNEKGIARIDVNEPLAEIILWSFEEIAKGVKCVEDIRKEANEKGLKVNKSHFWMMIRNPLYCGLIEVPKYKDDDYEIVKGQHSPIISKELFESVQAVLNGRKRQNISYQYQREEFPLRGYLECSKCGSPLTASISKGKYPYYHCKASCGERMKVGVLNEKVEKIFEKISAKTRAIELLKVGVKRIFQKNSVFKSEGSKSILQEIEKVQSRLSNAQQMMLDGDMNLEEYRNIKSRYEPQLAELNKKKIDLAVMDTNLETYLNYNLNLLSNLSQLYVTSDVHKKQLLLSSTFSKKIVFQNNECRTPPFNNVVSLLFNIDKGLSDGKTKTARLKDEQFVEVEATFSKSNLLIRDLLIIEAFN